MLKLKTHTALVAALWIAGAASAATTQGLANGGFEVPGTAGQIAAGWLTAATNSPAVLSSNAHSGNHSLLLSAHAFDASIALQNSVGHGLLPPLGVANVGDTPLLTFWAKGDASTTGNAFVKLEYLGANGIVGTAIDQQFQGFINTGSWTQVSFQAAAIPAGATAVYLQVGTAVGPILDGRASAVFVDDVQLTLHTAAVPEPETHALLMAGLGLVAATARRRRA